MKNGDKELLKYLRLNNKTIFLYPRMIHKNWLLWGEIVAKYKKILIIGYPKSGKSTLFKIVKDFGFHNFYLQTDDYKDAPYLEQLYIIIDELEGKDDWVVEGIQGYRLLRKYIQTESYDLKPDLIIVCESQTRVPDPKHDRMCKGLDKIWEEYCDLEKYPPEIIYYIN